MPPGDYRSRNSMRHPLIDYTRGNFFVTTCLEKRHDLFATIQDGKAILSAAGPKKCT
ncbi:hypothetical protein IT575_13555 [bacterium]|nr:hypothetical protein [bacterium]